MTCYLFFSKIILPYNGKMDYRKLCAISSIFTTIFDLIILILKCRYLKKIYFVNIMTFCIFINNYYIYNAVFNINFKFKY